MMIDTSSKKNFRECFQQSSGEKMPFGLIKGMQKFIKRDLDKEA
jgi:hypothetical protein